MKQLLHTPFYFYLTIVVYNAINISIKSIVFEINRSLSKNNVTLCLNIVITVSTISIVGVIYDNALVLYLTKYKKYQVFEN